MTILRLRRLETLAAVLEAGASRPVLIARVAAALVLGREALSARSWHARGVDLERGVTIVLGAREADGRWPAGLAFAAADPGALLRWLAVEGLAAVVVDGVVRCGPAGGVAADALAGPSPEGALADLEAPLDRGKLSAVLRADGVLSAHAHLDERIDALGGGVGVATVKSSRVPGIDARDHVLVARGRVLDGAPLLTAARDVVPAAPGAKVTSAVLATVPWPTPWHSHPLRRVFRID